MEIVLLKRKVGASENICFEWWEVGEMDKKYNQRRLYNCAGSYNFLCKTDVIIETVTVANWNKFWANPEHIKKTAEYQELAKDSTDKTLKIGWLSPEGKMHYCQYHNHIAYVNVVLNSTASEIEKQGWIHILKNMSCCCRNNNKRMTQEQARTAREELGLHVFDDDVMYQ